MEGARTSARRLGRAFVALLMLAMALQTAGAVAPTTEDVYPLTFPIAGAASYADTWGAPRSEGRKHQGADIFAAKGTPVVAAADGIIARIAVGERAGRYMVLHHSDGWRSYYLHLDNDTPGTDDGAGGQPAPGIEVGASVQAGAVLDFVGDSGNAELTPSHLHFELHRPDGEAINPTPHLRAAEQASIDGVPTVGIEGQTGMRAPTHHASGTELVGYLDPGGGFAAGVTVHQDIAYLGTWGRPRACPASGVRIIDVADPTQPLLLGTVASGDEFPGTSTDSVWVGEVATEQYQGVVAVVAVRLCDTTERGLASPRFRGIAIYDTSNPASPELLSTVHGGPVTQGANEVTAVVTDEGRLLVGVTIMQSFLHTNGTLGDFRLVDATDPRNPIELADWDQRRSFPTDWANSDVMATDYHIHSATFAAGGREVWLAAWDGGLVHLDVSDPSDPRVIAVIEDQLDGPGNTHSVAIDASSGLVISSNEVLAGEPVAGSQIIYGTDDRGGITELSRYSTPGEAPLRPTDGFFTAHEAVIRNSVEYVSAYSDGLRVIDLSDPANPVETASFVPPPSVDPHGYWIASDRTRWMPLVWGVAVADDLIYLSDINSGLWIVRLTHPSPTTDPL